MLRLLGKTLALAATLAGIAIMASPELFYEAIGWHPGFSDTMSRVLGAIATLVSFALFSGPSKFGAEDSDPAPDIPVDHLLTALKSSHPELVTQTGSDSTLRDVLRHLADRRKIAAIKVLRAATGCGLKDAKETVDAIERALRANAPTEPRG